MTTLNELYQEIILDHYRQVLAMVMGEREGELETLCDIAALEGVRHVPVRVKCATLAWHALEEALKQVE